MCQPFRPSSTTWPISQTGGGYLNAVNKNTGALIWRHQISTYDGIAGAVSRTSPAVADGLVYIGDQNGAI